MIHTRLTELFCVDLPTVQGGMQWFDTAQLVAAVAEARASGCSTALTKTMRSGRPGSPARAMTDRPFGVNLTILRLSTPPPHTDPFEAIGHLAKVARGGKGLERGDTEHGICTAGMVQGLIHDILSVADLIARNVGRAKALIRWRLDGCLVTSEPVAA